jgi:asparagine synthase (glutamine-hydrolysing)
MLDRMIHRGPDDSGARVGPGCALGMRRLSIIDVEGGHQPISNEDGTVTTVFNGEIYNFRELRAELEGLGHRFATRSDTEVLVHGYEQWGDEFVTRLNGIFGLCVWDEPRRRLLLARDHFGVKPLYFVRTPRFAFASEVKPLLALNGVTAVTDLESLDLFLSWRFVPSPHTMFQGIRRLPPGHRLVLDARGARIERYFPAPAGPLPERSRDEWIELLRSRLERAVHRQMVSDVPIGALLSGGADSAAIVALMRRHASGKVRTFSVGFEDGGSANELADARATATLYETDHQEVLLGHVDYARSLEETIRYLEEPLCTPSALPMLHVCRLARQSVKVVLTGQGADEPHAGYARYLAERYGGPWRSLPWPVQRALRAAIDLLPRTEQLKRAARSLGIPDPARRFAEEHAVFEDATRERLWRPELRPAGGEATADVMARWLEGLAGRDPLQQLTFLDARTSLSDDLLLYGDKMSMATSVEARVPFLDPEYMEVAEALPSDLRIRGRTRKYAHRLSIAGFVPQEILERPKRGFEAPIDRWFRSELSGYVRETLLAAGSACRAHFDERALEALLREHVEGRRDRQRQLYALLVFELWHREFVRGRA